MVKLFKTSILVAMSVVSTLTASELGPPCCRDDRSATLIGECYGYIHVLRFVRVRLRETPNNAGGVWLRDSPLLTNEVAMRSSQRSLPLRTLRLQGKLIEA